MLRGLALVPILIVLALPSGLGALPSDLLAGEPDPARSDGLEARRAPSATVLVPSDPPEASVQEATVVPVRGSLPLARVALAGLAAGLVVIAAARALFPARLQRTHAPRVEIPLTDLREVLALARAAEASGNAERALALYRRALELDPLQAEARAGRARSVGAGATSKRPR